MRLKWFLTFCLCFTLLACSGIEIPPDKQEYIGEWKGGGVMLWIGEDGRVEYESRKGSASTEINAPIQKFEGNNFDVGVWFFSTTFQVQKPPYQTETGEWKMLVDGVELTRLN